MLASLNKGEAFSVYGSSVSRSLQSFPPDTPREVLEKCIDEDGGLILMNCVTPEDCDDGKMLIHND